MSRLFPNLKDTEWLQVNLNDLHLELNGANKEIKEIMTSVIKQNLLLDYAISKYKDNKSKAKDIKTYGGFGENRDELWFSSKNKMYHLGVDFNNLNEGQEVRSLTDGTICHILKDTSPIN